MRLIDAIRYSQGSNIAFVGAGGKTTAIFRVAREILAKSGQDQLPHCIFITTTTHIGAWQATLADHVVKICSLTDISNLGKHIPEGAILFTGGESYDRLRRLPDELLDALYFLAKKHAIPLLIEADGSHQHPLKAPALYEPVIPEFVETIIVVAGLRGLEKPLSSEWVHRPERFAVLSRLNIGDQVTSEALVNVLLHKDGGLKGLPANVRKIALLNQADTPALQAQAKKISERLIGSYHSCIIASLIPGSESESTKPEKNSLQQSTIFAVVEPIAGIILAAGGSSRFGQPKQLLDWNGEPMVRRVVNMALKAGLSPLVVVVGASADDVAAVINDLPLRIVINSEWSTGKSSTIKVGINSLPEELGGVVFLQCDQPQIPQALLKSLIETHQTNLSPIVAPLIDGQRGNPVLFDRITFSEFHSLQGEMGGRKLFSRFQVQWLNWIDKNLLLDIDTPADYEKLLAKYSQGEI